MTTAYVTDTRFSMHTFSGHPENASRLEAIHDLLDSSGMSARLKPIAPVEASTEQLLAVHTAAYLELLRSTEMLVDGAMLTQDTYVLPESFEIARYSAGGGIAAVDALMSGEAENALVVTRPPGHHATPSEGMGFCLLSNVAVTARHAQRAYRTQGIERVMIVDYDVHHGNGTQDVFYADPSVLFVSTHQSPWYPGTGAVKDIGTGAAAGMTLNMPLSAGAGDDSFGALYEQILWPIARRFAPNLILVSAGFDAHWAEDPGLGQLRLTLPGYAHLSAELKHMALELCDRRIVFILEGGYDLTALSHGVLNIAHVLLGDAEISDPLGPAPSQASLTRIEPLLTELKRIHHLESN
jgi:acetoin utilization deacetylase AcuC-like enzyme